MHGVIIMRRFDIIVVAAAAAADVKDGDVTLLIRMAHAAMKAQYAALPLRRYAWLFTPLFDLMPLPLADAVTDACRFVTRALLLRYAAATAALLILLRYMRDIFIKRAMPPLAHMPCARYAAAVTLAIRRR